MKRVLTSAAIIAAMMPRDFEAAVLLNASRAQGTVNQVLTNFAVGVANETADDLANFIAPVVPTGAQHGQYKTFESKDAFQVYNSARAVGGPRTRIEFGADDAFFNCKPQGLEIGIDDSERDPGADPLSIEQAKIRTLVINTNTSHAAKVMGLIKSVKAATGSVGEWSDATVDPVAEIDAQILAIANATGQMPNRMLLGLGAWSVIKNHVLVRGRLSDNNKESVTMSQFAAMLLNPDIEIKVSAMVRDTAKTGKAASNSGIVGNEVFIFLASVNPTQFDPSFAKTFMVSTSPINSVREYRDETVSSDMYCTDWSEDVQVVSSQCAKRITLS